MPEKPKSMKGSLNPTLTDLEPHRNPIDLDTEGNAPPLNMTVRDPEGLGGLGFVATVFYQVVVNNTFFGLADKVGQEGLIALGHFSLRSK